MTLLEDSTQLNHKLTTSEKQVLKAHFEQQLSQLTYEQKQKLLEDIIALSALYADIMKAKSEDRNPK